MEHTKPTYEELQQINKHLVKQLDDSKTILDNTIDWALLMIPSGEFFYCSPSCEIISGYSANEFIEDPNLFLEIIHPLDKELVNQHFYNKKQNIETDKDLEFRIITKDGNIKWIEHFCKKAFDKADKFIGYCSSNRDISKRKEIQIEYDQTIKLLHDERQIFIQGNAVVFKWKNSKNWPVEYVSPNVEHIFGFTPEEMQSPQFIYSNFIFFEDLQRVESEVTKFSKRKEKHFKHEPYRVIGKDGKVHWVSDYTIILRNDSGKITNYIGYLVDITELKLAEVALQENNEWLSTMLNSIGDGVIATDKNGLVTGMNPVAEKFCGWSNDKAIGKSLTEVFNIVNAETLNPVDNPVKMVMETGATVGLANHTILISNDGNKYQISDSAAPIKYKDDKISGVILVFSDVTESYAAQKIIKENEIRYHSIFQNSPSGIMMIDENGIVCEANAAISKISGYSIDDLIGSDVKKLTVPENKNLVDQNIKQVLSGKLLEQEVISCRKDGSHCNLILREAAIMFPNGKKGILSISNDITSQKNAEALLRKSEDKNRKLYTLLRLMSDTMPDLLWAKDLNGRYIFTNKSICENLLNARDTSEPIGKTDMFFAQRERDSHPKNLQYHTFGELCSDSDKVTLQEMKEMQFYEHGNVKGKFHYLDVYKAPLIDNNGKLIGVVGSARDITEKRKAIDELIVAKERAEESDRLKSAFLANMSHEIRTPMNGILGFAGLLKEYDLSSEKQQEYINLIEKGSTRMLNIINDIISISKIESGTIKVKNAETNINKQIEYIYTFFNPEVEAKGINFLVKNKLSSAESILLTDHEKVYSILTNLVKNAIKYTDKGSIELGCRKDSDYAEFYIRDTGIGIPKERQKAVFERFIQADIADLQARQGAGLGLSISKAYVELLGGKIWLESEEGKGSTFYFTIPFNVLPEEIIAKKTVTKAEDKTGEIKSIKILIAEDDEASEMLLSITVNEISKEVLKTKTGKETIEIYRKNPDIDLILMDIQMPNLNGYEATRQIRKFNKKVVIIAQTAFGLTGDREKAIEAGCNDYIAKPVNKDELLALIHKYFK